MPPVIELFIFEAEKFQGRGAENDASISIWRSSIYSGDGQKLILYLCSVLSLQDIDPFRGCTLNGNQVCSLIRFCHDEFNTQMPEGVERLVSNESNYVLFIDDW